MFRGLKGAWAAALTGGNTQRKIDSKPYKCHHCFRGFPNKGALSIHIKSKHTIKINLNQPSVISILGKRSHAAINDESINSNTNISNPKPIKRPRHHSPNQSKQSILTKTSAGNPALINDIVRINDPSHLQLIGSLNQNYFERYLLKLQQKTIAYNDELEIQKNEIIAVICGHLKSKQDKLNLLKLQHLHDMDQWIILNNEIYLEKVRLLNQIHY